MDMYENLGDAQKNCIKKLALTAHFDSMKMYTALSLMKPAMKDQSSISYQAPCGALQRANEKLETFIEGVPQLDLAALVHAL